MIFAKTEADSPRFLVAQLCLKPKSESNLSTPLVSCCSTRFLKTNFKILHARYRSMSSRLAYSLFFFKDDSTASARSQLSQPQSNIQTKHNELCLKAFKHLKISLILIT